MAERESNENFRLERRGEAYESSHQGVTIEMVDLGSSDYMTVLATELSGDGSDFDVVTIKDVPGYATPVQKNFILPLDDYISADGVCESTRT